MKVWATSSKVLNPFEVSANLRVESKDLQDEANLDLDSDFKQWLPYAATAYKLSKDVRDFTFVPVVIFPSELPNRNGIGFPLSSLVQFNPERGVQSYKTWKGQPCHIEHKNKVIEDAKGVIVDTFLTPLSGYKGNLWKLLVLAAYDRTKDRELVSRINTGKLNTYSMGAFVENYQCSVCGAFLGNCRHLNKKHDVDFYEYNGLLVYRRAVGPISGFELSAVEVPAFQSAKSNIKLRY